MDSEWRILLVEDDIHSQRVASTVLKYYHVEVDVVGDASEALQRLSDQTYTAALIDLALPETSGWDLLKAIKSNPATAHLPCIAITAYHSARVAQEAIDAGFRAYFAKPIDPRNFFSEIQYYLS